MSKKTKIILKSILVLSMFALSIHVFASWVAPTAAAPGVNAFVPLNIGAGNQTKNGNLVVAGTLSANGGLFAAAGIFSGAVQIGTTGSACSSSIAGAVRYNSATPGMEFCNGVASWVSMGGGSGGSSQWTGTNPIAYTGTANITGNLNVSGAVTATTSLCIASDCRTAWPSGTSQWTTAGSDVYYSTGNVGIGTTTPGAALEVKGVANQIILTGTGAETDINYVPSTGTAHGWQVGVGPVTPNSFQFYDNSHNTAQLTILEGGNVGIGTITPGYKLTLGGSGAVFGVDNTATFNAKNSAGTYEGYFWPRWSDNVMYMNYGSGGLNIRNNASTSAMFMSNAGYVGINTTNPGTYNLNVNGSVNAAQYCISGANCISAWPSGGTSQWTGTNPISYTGTANVVGNFTTSGKVGIGTTTLITPLEVDGPVTSVGQITLGSGSLVSGTNGVIDVPYSMVVNINSINNLTDRTFSIRANGKGQAGGTELFRVQEDGSVVVPILANKGPLCADSIGTLKQCSATVPIWHNSACVATPTGPPTNGAACLGFAPSFLAESISVDATVGLSTGCTLKVGSGVDAKTIYPSYPPNSSNGSIFFTLPALGAWTVTASSGTQCSVGLMY